MADRIGAMCDGVLQQIGTACPAPTTAGEPVRRGVHRLAGDELRHRPRGPREAEDRRDRASAPERTARAQAAEQRRGKQHRHRLPARRIIGDRERVARDGALALPREGRRRRVPSATRELLHADVAEDTEVVALVASERPEGASRGQPGADDLHGQAPHVRSGDGGKPRFYKLKKVGSTPEEGRVENGDRPTYGGREASRLNEEESS